ncbi:ABC transporter permease [Fodinibius halophilus]|uniref:ABC transporter permease n=1 Tax=Fodinibius halophilus TaxID=1736908 RepID=A0A6M1SX92_9BACT|nr:ABC transporter permease [Fodinibius halophilus]NGP88116.1 ABC transporter permease [Fodinibius halophilus]
MAEFLELTKEWFFGLGQQYGVNPIVFGSIYVGAIPFFSLSIGWLIRNYRLQKSIVLPSLLATFFFISAYLYLIIVGHNVPWWVYGIVVLMVLYGAFSTYKSVKKRIKNINQEQSTDE